MIIGIGSDLIKTARIKALLIKNKQRFLHRIFTDTEIILINNINNIDRLAGYVAKRFAAKEACAKAFGTGIGASLSFRCIEVFQDKNGKPYLKLKDKSVTAHLSMADESDYAQAFVILEKSPSH